MRAIEKRNNCPRRILCYVKISTHHFWLSTQLVTIRVSLTFARSDAASFTFVQCSLWNYLFTALDIVEWYPLRAYLSDGLRDWIDGRTCNSSLNAMKKYTKVIL